MLVLRQHFGAEATKLQKSEKLYLNLVQPCVLKQRDPLGESSSLNAITKTKQVSFKRDAKSQNGDSPPPQPELESQNPKKKLRGTNTKFIPSRAYQKCRFYPSCKFKQKCKFLHMLNGKDMRYEPEHTTNTTSAKSTTLCAYKMKPCTTKGCQGYHCRYCHNRGHKYSECRKRKAEVLDVNHIEQDTLNTIDELQEDK